MSSQAFPFLGRLDAWCSTDWPFCARQDPRRPSTTPGAPGPRRQLQWQGGHQARSIMLSSQASASLSGGHRPAISVQPGEGTACLGDSKQLDFLHHAIFAGLYCFLNREKKKKIILFVLPHLDLNILRSLVNTCIFEENMRCAVPIWNTFVKSLTSYLMQLQSANHGFCVWPFYCEQILVPFMTVLP